VKGIPIKEVQPKKIGNSFWFRIPKQYLTNEAIIPGKLYNILITPIVK